MRKQTMRMLSVLLCVLMTVSSFSVLTAFAKETSNNNTTKPNTTTSVSDNEKNDDSTLVEYNGKDYGTGDLTNQQDVNTLAIKSENQYYSIVADEENTSKAMVKSQALDGASTLPSKIDNSKSKYFPPIKSQGKVGSCTAWAQVYYQFSYAQNKALNRTATYDNSFSPLWAYNYVNRDVDKGSSANNIYDILKNVGCPTLKTVPNISNYLSWETNKEAYREAVKYKINNYEYISYGSGNTPITNPKDTDLNTLKSILNNDEIISFSTYVEGFELKKIVKDNRTPENSKYVGEYIAPYLNSTDGSHRMTIVGYDDDIWCDINEDGIVQDSEKGAFKVANSWGTNYCNNGFVWVSYDALNNISSVNNSSLSSKRLNRSLVNYPARLSIKPTEEYSGINLEFCLSSLYRGNIRVKAIAEDKITGKKIYSYLEPFITIEKLNRNSTVSFDGSNNVSSSSFAIDLKDIVPNINSNNITSYKWTINFADIMDDESTLTAFDVKIVDTNTNKTYKPENKSTISVNNSSDNFYINNNSVTIYYKGYENPNIHYQVGNGSWTAVPGVSMLPDNSVDGCNYAYTIDLGNSLYTNVCFNDGHNNWDSRNGQNYRFTSGTYKFINGVITPFEKDKFGIDSVEMTPADGKINVNETLDFRVKLKNAESTAEVKFAYKDENGQENYISSFGSNLSAKKQFTKAGKYTLVVYAREHKMSDDIVKLEKDFTVVKNSTMSIDSFNFDNANDKNVVGFHENVKMSAKVSGGTAPYQYKFSYYQYGQEHILQDFSTKFTCENVFDYQGSYTINLTVKDATGFYEKVSKNLTVVQTYISGLKCNNSVIKVGSTNNITADINNLASVVTKDDFVYTVTKDNKTVTLKANNDKSADWTPNEAGTYTVSLKINHDGKYIASASHDFTVVVGDPLTIDSFGPTKVNYYDNLNLVVKASGGKAPYQYEFIEYPYSSKTVLQSFSSKNTYTTAPIQYLGVIQYGVIVKDATGNTVTKNIDVAVLQTNITDIKSNKTTIKENDTVKLSANVNYESSLINSSDYTYTVTKDNKTETLTTNSDKSANWTPKNSGEYTVSLEIKHNGKYIASTKKTFKVEETPKENLTAIYYTGYSTPYIHYQVENGSWTNAPGYKMYATNEMSGYTHKYVINLGSKNYANVCFNNGNGNWDSNNGRNYRFNKGTYTYKNGVITPVEDDKFGIDTFDITPADGKITVGDYVDMKVTLKNIGNLMPMVKFAYVTPEGKEYDIHQYTYTRSDSKQFTVAGTYKVRVYANTGYGSTDYVMAEKTVTVTEKQPLKINSLNTNAVNGKIPYYDNLKVTVNVLGGKAPYQYKYVYTQYNYDTLIQDFSSSNTCTKQCTQIGPFTIKVIVKDAEGAEVTQTVDIYAIQGYINKINFNKESVKVGETVKITPEYVNLPSYINASNAKFIVTKDGKTETLTTNNDLTANWTPKEAGDYKITVDVYSNDKLIAGKSVLNYKVDKASENVITIYYKGYSTPYIHYQVGNGNWTAVPGVAMTATNEKSGYTHKYTINLGTSTYANVCFNNGNGSWDSRNGQNYHFEKGTYTFSNGTMTKIAD